MLALGIYMGQAGVLPPSHSLLVACSPLSFLPLLFSSLSFHLRDLHLTLCVFYIEVLIVCVCACKRACMCLCVCVFVWGHVRTPGSRVPGDWELHDMGAGNCESNVRALEH